VTRRRAGTLLLVTIALVGVLVVVVDLGVEGDRSSADAALGVPAAGAGLADGGSPTGTAPGPTGTTTTSAPPAPASTVRGPLGNGQEVTIAFGGDSHFESHVRIRLDREGAAMLAPLGPLFAGSDLQILNLETAITERGAPQPKEWTFRAPERALSVLADSGVDAVSMANNHGLDFGVHGLEDSLAARDRAPLAVIGIGRDASDAYRPYRTKVRGQRISVIAATQVLDEELIATWTASDAVAGGAPDRAGLASAKKVDLLTAAVARARASADTVVVLLHWGQERTECPTARQQELAPALLAAGADIVVGSHAHRLLGAGRMGEGFVAYGLGNFIWFNEQGPNGDTGVLHVTATGRHIDGYEWRPARIRNGVPTALDSDSATEARTRWDSLRGCTGLRP
jgi:poly-gamma-glutamate synthesis protein (capsule biosynthesis protein)